MNDTLFDVPAETSDPDLIWKQLVAAYERELLANPPASLPSLAEGNQRRVANARRYARADVDRLMAGLQAAGVTIVLKGAVRD